MLTMRSEVVLLVACAACTAPTREDSVTQAVTQCGSGLPEGVDVYSGTGTIDWTKLAASGRKFAFIKATQGDYNVQSTFQTQWSAALAAGVLRSPYHFFDATSDAVGQANAFLAQLTMAGGLQVGDLPPLLDLECPTAATKAASSSSCEGGTDSGWVAPATLAQDAFDWLDTVQQATGVTPIIYSYPSWFADVTFTDPRLANYPLFIASYSTCATVPAPWTSAVFWQYSATTTVPGIAKATDVDRFFGSDGDLAKLTIQPPAPMVDAGVGPDADVAPVLHQTGGCDSSDAPSPWWLVGFGVLVIGIRSQRRKVAR
jgi:lysozyme